MPFHVFDLCKVWKAICVPVGLKQSLCLAGCISVHASQSVWRIWTFSQLSKQRASYDSLLIWWNYRSRTCNVSLLRLVLKTKCLSWLFFLFQQVLLLFQTPIKCFTLLFRYMALGIALRYVLDALRKPFQSKMYLFGITALDRFRMR